MGIPDSLYTLVADVRSLLARPWSQDLNGRPMRQEGVTIELAGHAPAMCDAIDAMMIQRDEARALLREAHDYFAARNLGAPADALRVKLAAALCDSQGVSDA